MQIFLRDLSKSLKELQRRKLAKQADIEAATGIDQTVISRAKNLQLKRVTPAVRELKRYADMCLRDVPVRPVVISAAQGFYGAGGTEDELVASINLVTKLIGSRTR